MHPTNTIIPIDTNKRERRREESELVVCCNSSWGSSMCCTEIDCYARSPSIKAVVSFESVVTWYWSRSVAILLILQRDENEIETHTVTKKQWHDSQRKRSHNKCSSRPLLELTLWSNTVEYFWRRKNYVLQGNPSQRIRITTVVWRPFLSCLLITQRYCSRERASVNGVNLKKTVSQTLCNDTIDTRWTEPEFKLNCFPFFECNQQSTPKLQLFKIR
jgi:hypothetical protein